MNDGGVPKRHGARGGGAEIAGVDIAAPSSRGGHGGVDIEGVAKQQ